MSTETTPVLVPLISLQGILIQNNQITHQGITKSAILVRDIFAPNIPESIIPSNITVANNVLVGPSNKLVAGKGISLEKSSY